VIEHVCRYEDQPGDESWVFSPGRLLIPVEGPRLSGSRYGFEGVSIRGISQVIIGILSVIEIDRHNNELLVLERQDHPVHPYPQGE